MWPVEGGTAMVFKARKIPKHLIIHEEYELRKRSSFGLLKFILLFTAVVVFTYVISLSVASL
jgi:hypothetical protein